MILRSAFTVLLLLSPISAASQSSSQPLSQATAAVPQQRFVCNTGYTAAECSAQMAVLRPVLDRYGANRLGEWTWVLVRSGDWKRMKERLGLDPDSPAFSYLPARETFFEEALVVPVPGRSAELMRHWESSMADLLVLAVTHELGHGLCGERDEHKADANGRLVRSGAEVTCRR